MNNNSNNCGDCGTTCSECGRPWAICKQDGGCGRNKCKDIKFCEYGRMANGCIREKQPGCPMQAVIPSVTVESIEGIKNLADCLVHVSDINTTFYIDDKHRPIITWAGPIDIPGYDMEGNPNNYRDQIVTDVANQIAVIYDKFGNGYTFGLAENLNVQEEINNKLDAMAEDGTLGAILVEYLQPTIDAQNNRINGLENDYNTLSARMDTFTNLPEGSTSGDAELADIRTGFNGFTFTSAGSAVRGEDSYIDNKVNILEGMAGLIPTNWEIGAINPNTGEDMDRDTFIRTNGYITRNYGVYVKVETGYRGAIVWYNDDNTLASVQNFTGSFSASHKTATKFRLAVRSNSDNVDASVDFAKYVNLYDLGPYIIQDNCEGNIFVDFDNTNKNVRIKTYGQAFVFLRGTYQSIYNLDTTVAYPEETGVTYSLIYDFVTKTFSIIPFTTTPNTHQRLITKFILSSGQVVHQRLIYPNGNVNILVDGKSLSHIFNNISILGDSYSTYKDWILPTDRDYYPTASSATNDVQSVTQTYWYQLAHSLNSNILVNDSFGGSTVALTVRTGHTYEDSFIRRMENSFGKGRAGEQKPDLILICGGTNDFWNDVTVGSVKYSGWTESDLQKFAPAFCYMLSYIKEFNPNAKIVNITNDILGTDYKSAMSTACSHYSVLNVSLSDITKMSSHPDIEGMESIHDQVLYNILRTI